MTFKRIYYTGDNLIIILFFLFAFLVVFLSIKLSYYADLLSKTSKVSQAFIGGVLLAGITSLPEFVTCISAVLFKNPNLALGDILGSNFFNIFIVAFFDLVFLKKFMFNKLHKHHYLVYILLFINYVTMYLYYKGYSFNIFNIGLPSLVIFITYIFYLKSLKSREDDDIKCETNIKYIPLRLFLSALLMVISSIFLTFFVNKISIMYPSFSSSLLGAILLGITTSLPEVITFYALINLNNYNLALANIIGSNLFNLFVLAVSDLFFAKNIIYNFFDNDSFLILKLGMVVTAFLLFHHLKFFNKSKVRYVILSGLIVVCYLLFWGLKFIR